MIEGTEICATCPKPDDWQRHAKCLDDVPAIKAAIRICIGCPVRGLCLEDAWESKQRYGIWGSFSAAERERLRKAFPLPENVKDKRKVIRVIAHRL